MKYLLPIISLALLGCNHEVVTPNNDVHFFVNTTNGSHPAFAYVIKGNPTGDNDTLFKMTDPSRKTKVDFTLELQPGFKGRFITEVNQNGAWTRHIEYRDVKESDVATSSYMLFEIKE